jgi:large subunit ribosomal protein L15
MKLNELSNQPGSKTNRKRVGRGIASGTGKTCGRGVKGQKSRSGVTIKGEGGQMPLVRRMPKRGFVSRNKTEYQIVNLYQIQKAIDDKKISSKDTITKEILQGAGLIHTVKKPVSLLATGEIKDKANIEVTRASKAAEAKVSKAGGSVILPAEAA